MSDQNIWRTCNACKKPIHFGQTYQVCSVSTCKKNAYCSVNCWELHVPILNHKNAWAEEERAPLKSDISDAIDERPRRRIIVTNSPNSAPNSTKREELPQDILIVASKLKQFVKEASDMNTSANVMDALSDIVRELTLRGIENARMDGRKTLMDRDFINIFK